MIFLYDGVWDTMTGHARRRGIKMCTLSRRITRYGNTPEQRDKILHVGKLSHRALTFDGITDTRDGWARRLGVTVNTIYRHFSKRPMTAEEVATIVRNSRRYPSYKGGLRLTYKGETHNVCQWSRILGIGRDAILYRVHMGWPVAKVLSKSPQRRHESKRNGSDYGRQCKMRKNLKSLGVIV